MEQRPSQARLFNTNEQPTRHWCFFVEYRIQEIVQAPPEYKVDVLGFMGDWGVVVRPNHFRTEEGAAARVEELKAENKRPVSLGLIEFRVVPKYLGYVPDDDEAWIV